jgi:hypothetical protein
VRRAVAGFVALLAVAIVLYISPAAHADASSALQNVLSELQSLSNTQFGEVVTWAQSGKPFPNFVDPSTSQAETDILHLMFDDRSAVFSWLNGNGRDALYARGATQDEIGPNRPGADYPASTPTPSPTPNPWRSIPLASQTLGGDTQHRIRITSSFAAVAVDGSGFVACFSFVNTAPLVATEVDVSIPIYDGNGSALGAISFQRTGTFSPNIGIDSYASLNDWQNPAFGPRSMMDGCIQKSYGSAQLPLLRANYASYVITRVQYQDGSSI